MPPSRDAAGSGARRCAPARTSGRRRRASRARRRAHRGPRRAGRRPDRRARRRTSRARARPRRSRTGRRRGGRRPGRWYRGRRRRARRGRHRSRLTSVERPEAAEPGHRRPARGAGSQRGHDGSARRRQGREDELTEGVVGVGRQDGDRRADLAEQRLEGGGARAGEGDDDRRVRDGEAPPRLLGGLIGLRLEAEPGEPSARRRREVVRGQARGEAARRRGRGAGGRGRPLVGVGCVPRRIELVGRCLERGLPDAEQGRRCLRPGAELAGARGGERDRRRVRAEDDGARERVGRLRRVVQLAPRPVVRGEAE